MKKLFSLLLVLTMLLALAPAAVLAAEDPVGDAMRAYAGIVAGADGYAFISLENYQIDKSYYQYALVDLADDPWVPTLLLRLYVESPMLGMMGYTRVFRYDPDSGAVIAPDECLQDGVAAAGGFRGGIGLLDGLLAVHAWAAMNGQGSIYQVTLVGGKLENTTLWSGIIDQTPYVLEAIDWKEIGDTAVFDAYRAAAPAVVLSPQKLSVDGVLVDCEKYNIDGSNYFKLRDLAMLFNDTPAQFGVGYDPVENSVIITPGMPYEPVDGELVVGADKSSSAVPSSQRLVIGNAVVNDLSVYNIGGNNYFKLRDLSAVLGFFVDYDPVGNVAVVKTSGQG